MVKTVFTTEQAKVIGELLGIKFDRFGVEDFRYGLDVELEHGTEGPLTNVTNSDPFITGKIAWAHLNEYPDYYVRLAKMEEEAEEYWEGKKKAASKKAASKKPAAKKAIKKPAAKSTASKKPASKKPPKP